MFQRFKIIIKKSANYLLNDYNLYVQLSILLTNKLYNFI